MSRNLRLFFSVTICLFLLIRIQAKTIRNVFLASEIDKTGWTNEIIKENLSSQSTEVKGFPFVVSLQVLEGKKYKHQCGGSILSSQFVVSAAHCTLKPAQLTARQLFVVAGSNRLFDKNATRLGVKAMKKHPQFEPLRGHDILLLQLAAELPIDNIRFGVVDFRNKVRKGGFLDAWLLGWGRTEPNIPKDLEMVPFRTIEDKDCLLEHRFKYLTESEICAVNTSGPRGACDGDSGGPLWSVEEQTVYGILSYGRTPCEKGKPFAFTRLSVYSDWIDKEMANMLK